MSCKRRLTVGYPNFTDACFRSDRYFLFVSLKNESGYDPVDAFLQDIAARLRQTTEESANCSFPERKHYAIVNPASCLNYGNQVSDTHWLPLNHLLTGYYLHDWSSSASPGKVRATTDEKTSGPQDATETGSSDIDVVFAELIHTLADKLPLIEKIVDVLKLLEAKHHADVEDVAGHYLDIIWLATSSTDLTITDHIALYGALQRLCSWHGGLLTVTIEDTTPDRPQNDTLNTWLNCLHGQLLGRSDVISEVVELNLAWRGEIVLADSKGQQAVCLPGLVLSFQQRDTSNVQAAELESKSNIKSPGPKTTKSHPTRKIFAFSTQMEVVCSVHRVDVPSIYLSSTALSLHLLPCSKLPRSEYFLDWLKAVGQSDNTAVIVRLPCRRLTPAPSSRSSELINTKAWKERIKSGSRDLSIPDLHLRESQVYFYLLVHNSKESGNNWTAQVMYSPCEMNGATHARLVQHQDLLNFDQCENARSVLNTLPSFDARQVQTLLETLEAAQAEAVKMFIEERKSEGQEASMTLEELELVMRAVYCNVLAEVDEVSKSSQAGNPESVEDDLGHMQVISEIDGSPSQWLERLALQNLEALERKIKRFKSGDMMLAGLPVPVINDNTITLTAEEFLKHFQTNGLPSTQDLSPVFMATENPLSDRPNLSWSDIKKATFEKSQKYTHAFPGIQYCLDSGRGQQLDNRLSKMQQRYIRYETASTCSSDQASSPATLTIPQSSSSAGDPTSATNKGKSHHQKDKYSPRRQSTSNKDLRLVKEQKSAEKHRRTILAKGHGISPRTLSKGTKRSRKEPFISPSKKRLVPTRTSPRKRVIATTKPDRKQSPAKAVKVHEKSASASTSTSSKPRKMSNSEKNRMKLRQITKEAILSRGLTKESECYKACLERLYRTAELYVKDLKSSKGLNEEMKKIVEANADFVVQFEQNRIKKV